MTAAALHGAPLLPALLGLAAYAGAGLLLGIAYFGSLLWSTRRFATAGRMTAPVALMACRFLVLAAVLALASIEGAWPLMAMALGLLVGRSMVMRRVRMAAS